MVQLYFGHKLFLVSGRKKIFPLVVGILSLAQMGFSFAVVAEAFVFVLLIHKRTDPVSQQHDQIFVRLIEFE
jgi:hypothetical protein